MRAPEKTVKMWNIFMFSRYDKQLFFKSPKITEKGVFETFSYLFIFAVFFWLIFTPLHFSELVLILRFSLILFEHNFPQKRGISNFRVDLSNWLKKLLSWDLSPNNQSDSRVRDSRSFFDWFIKLFWFWKCGARKFWNLFGELFQRTFLCFYSAACGLFDFLIG